MVKETKYYDILEVCIGYMAQINEDGEDLNSNHSSKQFSNFLCQDLLFCESWVSSPAQKYTHSASNV